MKKILLILFLLLTSCKQIRDVQPKASERSLFGLTDAERVQKFEEDLNTLKRYDSGLSYVLDYAQRKKELFPKSADIALNALQRNELREIFSTILDYMRAIDGIKNYWKAFHKFGMIKEREAHSQAFLITYFAWLVQYKHGLEFIELTVPNITMEKILDENADKYEIPAGSFKALKWEVINVKAVGNLMGAHQYFKTLKGTLTGSGCAQPVLCHWAVEKIDDYHYSSKALLKDRAAIQFSYNAFDIVRDMSFDAWFPVQKNVAEWMGDTKVARLHRNLISTKDLQLMRKSMRPGDILVVRHNWYLSNIGLPGFWPHAELYLGDEEELRKGFSSQEVQDYLFEKYKVKTMPEALKSGFAIAWKAYKTQHSGDDKVILEAVSEGVVFSSMSEGAGADYVGVIRPKRSELERAKAILFAFGRHGLPYDFNFDFDTDESLVCTELVYKAYEPDKNFRGIAFPTTRVMGRNTLPANDLVKYYATTGKDDFEFVYFLDGVEKSKNAVLSDEKALKESWKRPKWDVVQK